MTTHPEPEPRLIDTSIDVHIQHSEVPVYAGVSDLRLIYKNGKLAFPVTLTIETSTNHHRGVHMSRLVHAAASEGAERIEDWLRGICRDVNKTQPGTHITCKFEMPYADQFIPVAIHLSESGSITYQFVVNGITACPCSKRMAGIGHMQRAELVLILKSRKPVDATTAIGKIRECFSTVPIEGMKRIDEARKILEAQDNPKFAEDLVRECMSRFPNALFIRSRCYESIHAHDAVATWTKKSCWKPEL